MANTQRLTILAQDPSVRLRGALLFAQVDVPHEQIAPGPVGHRVKVIDYDSTAGVLYKAHDYAYGSAGEVHDPFKPPERFKSAKARARWEQSVLSNPNFHAQHVYAVTMRVLARFEFALGRRTNWSFDGHQLHIAPHAFAEANAFYSEADRALYFGYFRGVSKRTIFTCLSHDIVAHETTHALLDGLRPRYIRPSGPDQAAFHEGFSDVVALLSMFCLRGIVELALTGGNKIPVNSNGIRLVAASRLTEVAIAESILLGLGKQFGKEYSGARTNALRRSVELQPSKKLLDDPYYIESHSRGEIFSAAMLRSFLALWTARIAQLGSHGHGRYNLDSVLDEGAKVADHLLTMAIRTLDYCPSVDLTFGDYLAALLTVDREVVPDDSRFSYREVIAKTFDAFGIVPPPDLTDADGCWLTFVESEPLIYSKTNFESMLRDKEEVFRFIWENREVLEVDERAYTQVLSVRPSLRQGPDGIFVRETVCEYVQVLELFGAECQAVLNFERPAGMPSTQRFTAYGGGVLIFDQYGRVKYHIPRRIADVPRQSRRLEYLWTSGALEQPMDGHNNFALAHRQRATMG